MSILSDIAASLQRGEDDEVASLVRQALDDGQDAVAILHGGLIAGMDVVGEQFREREIFLPDVLLAARAMYAGLALLKPLLAKDGVPTAGTVVIGSVHGDLHDIGKNLVGIMLAGAGFEVVDLGSDVAPERFVDAAQRARRVGDRPVGAPDHDHAGDEGRGGAGQGPRPPGSDQGHRGRCAGVRGVGPADRRRRVRLRRGERRRAGPRAGAHAGVKGCT